MIDFSSSFFRNTLVLLVISSFLLVSYQVPTHAQEGPWSGETVRILSWGKNWLFPPLIKDGEKQPLLKQFERETGINVEFSLLDEESVRQKAILDLTSGTAKYDIVGIGSWTLASYAPYLQPVDGYLREYPNDKYFQEEYFTEASRSANSMEGKLYSLPIYNHAAAIVYRKDLFRKHNVRIPRTIEELKRAARKLTRDTDGDGETDIYGITARARKGQNPPIVASGFAWAYGGTWFEGNASGSEIKRQNARPTFDTPEHIEGIDAYVQLLRNYAPPGVSNYSWVESASAVASGKVAMNIGFSSAYWWIRQNAKIDPEKFGVALAPFGPSGHRIQTFWNFSFGINQDSDSKLAAWQVLQLLGSQQMQKVMVENGTLTVPNYSLVRTDVARNQYPATDIERLVEALKIAEPQYMARFPEHIRLRQTFGTALSNAVAGKISTEEAMQDVQEQAEEIMTEGGYYE